MVVGWIEGFLTLRGLLALGLLTAALILAGCHGRLARSQYGSKSSLAETRWVKRVVIAPGATATFFDLCDQKGPCPNEHPLTLPAVAVGDRIQGRRIGAIKCDRFTRDIPGWSGGPKVLAGKGKWNCIASTSKDGVLNFLNASGRRSRVVGPYYPYILIKFVAL
jgi:hypothetical protein